MNLYISAVENDYHTLLKVAEMAGSRESSVSARPGTAICDLPAGGKCSGFDR